VAHRVHQQDCDFGLAIVRLNARERASYVLARFNALTSRMLVPQTSVGQLAFEEFAGGGFGAVTTAQCSWRRWLDGSSLH